MTSGPVPGTNGDVPGAQPPSNATAMQWDAENRLISFAVGANTISFAYDHLSRLITRSYNGTVEARYHYDGWNRIAEYNSSGSTLRDTFTWGLDLSGTMQGAGGVGGLLCTRWVSASGSPDYFPTYDGNGNVTEYLTTTGAVEAHYEYDPFGTLTRRTGSTSERFQYRFSTKPRISNSGGLYYYAYRWYNTYTGNWPSGDPIGERGGVNLYGFVGNDGNNWFDILGLAVVFENTWSRPNDDLWENKYETGQISVTIYANTDSCIECSIEWPNYETGEWEPTKTCAGWTKFRIGVGINITGSTEGIRESKTLLPNVTMSDPSDPINKDDFYIYDNDTYAILGQHAYGESDIGKLHCGGDSKNGQITVAVGKTGVQTINYSIKTEFCGKASASATMLNLDVDGGNSKRGGGGTGLPSLPLPPDAPGGTDGTPPSPMRPSSDPYPTFPGDTRPFPLPFPR